MTGDAVKDYTILFGGSSGHIDQSGVAYGDTWEYKLGVWTDLSPAQCTNSTCPDARTYGAMSYYDHSEKQYVVMFGGQYGGKGGAFLGDTWLFNGSWHNITPSPLHAYQNSPPPLYELSMSWDPLDGYVVLYGGCTVEGCSTTNATSGSISCQTWAFEGTTGGVARWANLTNAVHPPHLYSAGLAYDAADRYVVLFGGGGPGIDHPTYMNETWSYTSKSGWVNRTAVTMSSANTPPYRAIAGGQMVYYPSTKSVILFGGQHFWASPTSGDKTVNATLNDTWAFQNGGWTNLSGSFSASPHARFGGAMAYDPSDHALVMFGGLSGTMVNAPLLNDTWWYKGSPGEWTNHTTEQHMAIIESGPFSDAVSSVAGGGEMCWMRPSSVFAAWP